MIRWIGLAVAAIAVVAAIAAGTIWWLVQRDDALPASATDVVIPDGTDAAGIATLLAARGVIRDDRLLLLALRLRGGADRIEAAEYSFPAHLSVERVSDVLFAGGRQPAVWVTFPEGFTAEQIGARLQQRRLVDGRSFADAARAGSIVLPGGARVTGLEGYLFPDTYAVPEKTDADQVIRMMTAQFVRELPPNAPVLAAHLGYSLPKIVIVASMIEREAKADVDRPLIASVIYNRLRLGMPLEIDATIEYALPHHKTQLSFADLAIDSPYNTYRNAGLPPTAIANPGRASLLAALHPASTSFLYYVYRGNGRHEFSTTLEQQEENEQRFLP